MLRCHLNSKSCFKRLVISASCLGVTLPSSRRIIPLETVIRRCNCKVDANLSPVIEKSGSDGSNTKSVAKGDDETLLVMKAITTCWCGPTGSVKHSAGRTLAVDRSSKGKATRTILFLITDRLPIFETVNVLACFSQVLECWVARCREKPILLLPVVV